MTAYIVKDWIWALAFFPLWFVSAGTVFSLASGPKRIAGIRMRKLIDGAALVLSLGAATGALMWLDCASYLHLPFADQACRAFNLG